MAVLLTFARAQAPTPGAATGSATGTVVDVKMHDASGRNKDHLSSANVPGTNHGRVACAWAVNHVATDGLGHEVGGGLSTAQMAEALAGGRGRLVPVDKAPAGCVIISPTTGPVTGHVGILMDGTGPTRRIHSNSSRDALYMDNFTVQKWFEYFQDKKHLPVLVYELNK